MSVTDLDHSLYWVCLPCDYEAAVLICVCSVCYTSVNGIIMPWPWDLGKEHHHSRSDFGLVFFLGF